MVCHWSLFFWSVGSFIIFLSILGLYRFPNIRMRMHAAGIGDSLGIFFILLGCSLPDFFSWMTVKYGMLYLVLFFANTTAATLVAHIGIKDNVYK